MNDIYIELKEVVLDFFQIINKILQIAKSNNIEIDESHKKSIIGDIIPIEFRKKVTTLRT